MLPFDKNPVCVNVFWRLSTFNLLFVGMFIMVNQVQVNSLVIGYSFKYTDKIKSFSATSHMSH